MVWPVKKEWKLAGDGGNVQVIVLSPVWAHIKKDRHPAALRLLISEYYGRMSVEDAERIYTTLGEAIALAKRLKLENPKYRIEF